jgi:general secretion pathway protein E
MGVEPFLLASSLLGVLGQRLVRRLCPVCRQPHEATDKEIAAIGQPAPDGPLFSAVGCPNCNFTGYRGRTGIYELLTVDESMRRMIHGSAAEQDLRAHAVAQGMISMRQDGMRWVRAGDTALEEVLRVTRES